MSYCVILCANTCHEDWVYLRFGLRVFQSLIHDFNHCKTISPLMDVGMDEPCQITISCNCFFFVCYDSLYLCVRSLTIWLWSFGFVVWGWYASITMSSGCCNNVYLFISGCCNDWICCTFIIFHAGLNTTKLWYMGWGHVSERVMSILSRRNFLYD